MSGLRWLWVSGAVIVADYATKAAMMATFHPGEERVFTSFFSLVLTFNTGAAFSLFADGSGWQRWFFTAVAVAAAVVIAWLLRRGGRTLYCLGLALILGGALGNLLDRIRVGYVLDYVDVSWRGWHFWAFNVADASITIGAILVFLDLLLVTRHAPHSV